VLYLFSISKMGFCTNRRYKT